MMSEKEEGEKYVLGSPDDFDANLRLIGTSRGRIVQFVSLAAFLGLAGDLFGITSALLSLPPLASPARELKLDTYYPVGGFKRYVDDSEAFELVYPKRWLEDQAVYVARTNEQAGLRSGDAEALLKKRRAGPAAIVAFGPPRGTSRENLSVFRSNLVPGFSLRGTLGPPREAAQRLLDTAIAPEGSGKTATLIDARETSLGYYAFEYTLTLASQQITLHNLAVVAQRQGKFLYTLTILAPDDVWPSRKDVFEQVADSFKLF